MAFTYDSDLLSTSELYQIRLEIGDTNEYEFFLEDAEIQWVMDRESSFYSRCSKCCDLIVAKLSKEVDYTSGAVSEKLSQLIDRYKCLKSELSARGSGSYPWMRSISVSDKETNEADTDRTKPFFKRGLHDNT
jgi:hypothetical protein